MLIKILVLTLIYSIALGMCEGTNATHVTTMFVGNILGIVSYANLHGYVK